MSARAHPREDGLAGYWQTECPRCGCQSDTNEWDLTIPHGGMWAHIDFACVNCGLLWTERTLADDLPEWARPCVSGFIS